MSKLELFFGVKVLHLVLKSNNNLSPFLKKLLVLIKLSVSSTCTCKVKACTLFIGYCSSAKMPFLTFEAYFSTSITFRFALMYETKYYKHTLMQRRNNNFMATMVLQCKHLTLQPIPKQYFTLPFHINLFIYLY